MVATWSAPAVAAPSAAVGTINTERLRMPQGARDLILAHTDGTLVFAQGGEERQWQLGLHVTQVFRIASATLARAGLGALRRGVVEGSSEMTFLRSDGGLILGVALPEISKSVRPGPGGPSLDRPQYQGLTRWRTLGRRPTRRRRIGGAAARPSRAQAFRETLFELIRLDGVRGGLIVTPDGLVITSELPPRFPVEALAALAATLGSELELGATRLDRGGFRTALFSADDGTVFVGGSPVGYVTLVADRNVNMEAVRTSLGRAVDRLRGTWRTAGAA